jgi:hypothetical protein
MTCCTATTHRTVRRGDRPHTEAASRVARKVAQGPPLGLLLICGRLNTNPEGRPLMSLQGRPLIWNPGCLLMKELLSDLGGKQPTLLGGEGK